MARRKLTKAQKSAFREGMFFGWNKHKKALRKHKYKFNKTTDSIGIINLKISFPA